MSTENNTSALNILNDDSELSEWKIENLNSENENSRYSNISLISSSEIKNIYSAFDQKFKRTVTLLEPTAGEQNEKNFIKENTTISVFLDCI